MQLRAVHCGTATAAQLSLDPGTRSGPNMNGGVHESSTTCRLHSLSGCEGAVRASSPLPPRVAGRLHQLSDPAAKCPCRDCTLMWEATAGHAVASQRCATGALMPRCMLLRAACLRAAPKTASELRGTGAALRPHSAHLLKPQRRLQQHPGRAAHAERQVLPPANAAHGEHALNHLRVQVEQAAIQPLSCACPPEEAVNTRAPSLAHAWVHAAAV